LGRCDPSLGYACALSRSASGSLEALELDLLEVRLRDALGNHLLAAREYSRIATAARTAGWSDTAANAHIALARLRRAQGRATEATAHFEDAYRLAIDAHAHDAALDASVELLDLAACGPRYDLYLKRCQRLQPLASRGGRAHRELQRRA
jgi:hypothetical protein